jgi:acyl transferase domain-containing protein/acyl carrier protein
VKTNIGHLEAAAGIAGLIKAALALAHREIPAHLHFGRPSPKVPWDRLRLAVTRTATAWPRTAHPRTAGVSAFGFTGANAHVVLTEAPAPQPRPAPPVARPYALALSAASPAALEALRSRVADELATTPESGLADLAHTLGARRNHLEHRLVAVGSDAGELLGALRIAPTVATAGRDGTARFAAVFGPAVGDLSWVRLYQEEGAFAAALDAADAALTAAGSHASVRDELLRRSVSPGRVSPVAVTAAQIALAALWSDLGVRPGALAGFGAGRIAAAYVAGSWGLSEAMAAALDGGPVDIPDAATPLFTAAGPAGLADRLSRFGVEFVLDAGLSGAADEITATTPDGPAAVSTKDVDDPYRPVRLAAELHVRGCHVSWDALLGGRGVHVSGPSYPWQRRRHWIDSTPGARAVEPGRGLESGPAIVPVGADGDGVRYHPVHRVGTDPEEVVGAPDFVALVLTACREVPGAADFVVRDLAIDAAGVPAAAFGPGSGAHVELRPGADGWSVALVAGRHGARDAGPVLRALLTGTGTRPAAGDDAGAAGGTAQLAASFAALWHGREVVAIEAIRVRGGRLVDADGRIAAELSGLRYASDEPPVPRDASIEEMLYDVRWQEADLAGSDAAATAGRWLVLPVGPGDHEAASALAAELTKAGAAEARVEEAASTLAAEFTKAGAADARVDAATGDPGCPADDGLAGVALVATGEPAGTSVVEAALTAGRTLALAPAPPRLWLVTRGAQDPGTGGVLNPDRAAAWRMLRVLAMESGPAWGGCVDLDTSTGDYAAVASALMSRDRRAEVEDELVRRDGRWYVPRLVRAHVPAVPRPAPRCRADGRYVLVGSAAPYGAAIERLVAAGARRWTVVRPAGARDFADAERIWGEKMVAAGVQWEFRDAAQLPPAACETFAGMVVAPPPPATRPLAETGFDDVGAAVGFVALVERIESRLRGVPLDFFHVFGSAAASWGAAGMAAASVVDGALAALVSARRAAGRAAAVTAWMPGADTGELTRRDRLMMESSGLTPLSAADRAGAADLLFRGGFGDVAVARADVRRYAAACRRQTDRGFFASAASAASASAAAAEPAAGPDTAEEVAAVPAGSVFSAELAALHPRIRGEVLLDRVLGHVTDVLGEGPGGEVDPDRGFFDLGMDSVMAVALKSRLDAELGVDLPPTLTFEFPTSRALADHLLEGLREPEPESGPEPAPAPALDEDLNAMSEEELTARLLAELAVSDRLLAGEV